MQVLDTALDLIRKGGSLRTPQLAKLLEIGEGAVDAMLEPARADGRLTTCAVQAGDRRCIEYRLSASGGKYDRLTATGALKARPAERIEPASFIAAEPVNAGDAASSTGRADQAPPRPHPPLQHPQGGTMTATEMIVAALRKHGRPMTVPELRAHVKLDGLSGKVSVARQRGAIVKLGGGARDSIYGLPGQSAPKGDALERGAELGRKKAPKAKRAIGRKRAGGGSAAVRRKGPLKSPAKAFRPALASDGAILLLGAAGGDFEITGEQARAVVSLARRLSSGELAVLVSFIARLDGAQVAA